MPNFIDKETYEQANQELPDIDLLADRIAHLAPDFISMNFKPESIFPVAGACFQDASRTLVESRYALLESIAHRIWYREKTNPSNELAAVFYSRFYADDTALRLYSAAEHLAKAVVYIFNIPDSEITSKRTGSRFTTVRKILTQEEPTHIITIAIDQLYNSKDWQETINYRDAWVHQQPPLVKGLGMGFERKKRWIQSGTNKSYKLGVGSGDEAKYSIDDLLKFILPALNQFADTLTRVTEFYISELGKKGYSITD